MIKRLISRYGLNRYYHFCTCFFLTTIMGIIFLLGCNIYSIFLGLFYYGASISLSKEYNNISKNQIIDVPNVVADSIGIGLSIIFVLIIQFLINI